MKYLITGANGQLGQDFQDLLFKKSLGFNALGSKELDITDFPNVLSVIEKIRPEIIINCAAYTAVDQAETDWEKAFDINGFGVRNLAIAANKINATLVHFSTDYIFNGESDVPYTILDTPDPISCYGASKLLGETMIRDISREYILVRTSWVFGRGNDNFPKKVIQWSKGKQELTFVTDQVASPSYTKDLANATFDLVNKGAAGIFHISNSGSCSRYEWAMYILEKIGWDGTIKKGLTDQFPSPARRPRFSALNPIGTPEILGYKMPDWKDATDRFIMELRGLE